MKNPYLITLKPKNELLKKQIAYFYFHVSNNNNHSESFYFYPNYLHALTIYKGSSVFFGKNDFTSTVEPSLDKEKITFLYTINSKEKFNVAINGSFFKIGIVFYPLGINHFITKSLNEMVSQNFQEIKLPEEFEKIIAQIKQGTPIEDQLKLVEDALLAIYNPFDELKLKQAIKEIVLTNGSIRVEDLENITNLNRKTLLRLFKKHTFTTIEEYKKMVMFRNSLNYALRNKELVNLTDVALYNMYYDQSHFIKHFKSITNETPKTLLPKITQIGNEDLYWYFTEN